MIRITQSIVMCALLACTSLASADWQLDASASSVSFVSIKNESIAETHYFRQLRGRVSAAGKAELSIDLASVDTGIEIRDQRMRELLFQVAEHPQATISVQLDAQQLSALRVDRPQAMRLPLQLEVHGNSAELQAELLSMIDSAGCLHVLSVQPVLVNASDFALVDGINALRKVAGLGSIATVVPVSVHLQFSATNP